MTKSKNQLVNIVKDGSKHHRPKLSPKIYHKVNTNSRQDISITKQKQCVQKFIRMLMLNYK